MNVVHLQGAEAVERAAASMAGSAEKMRKSHADMDYTLSNHQRFMNDWLDRLRVTLEECLPSLEEPFDVCIVTPAEDDEHSAATLPAPADNDPSDDMEEWQGTD